MLSSVSSALPGFQEVPGVQEDAEASGTFRNPGVEWGVGPDAGGGRTVDTLPCSAFMPTSPMVGNQSVRGSPCPPRSFFRGDQETNHLCPSVSSTVISVRVVVSIERLSF